MIIKADLIKGTLADYWIYKGTKLLNFPVVRPVQKPIIVFDEHGNYIGHGFGSECRETGGCIKVGGKKIDSNHIVYWCYTE